MSAATAAAIQTVQAARAHQDELDSASHCSEERPDPYDSGHSEGGTAGDVDRERTSGQSPDAERGTDAEEDVKRRREAALHRLDSAVAEAGVRLSTGSTRLAGKATARRVRALEASTISAALSAVTASGGPSPVPATTAQRSHSTGSRVSFPPGHSRGSSYRSIPPPSQPIPPPDPDQESRLALSPSGTPVSGSGRSSPAGLHQEAAGDSQKQDHADKERPGKFEDDAKAVAAVLAGSASSSSPKGVTVEMVSSKHDLVPAQGSSTASPRSMTTRRRKRRLQSTGRSWSSVSDGDEDEFSGLQRNPWTRYGCVRGSRCILHPHGHVKSGWDIIMLPAIFYTATIMPFALAFEAENEGLEVTDWIVYAMFAMDMLIQFVSAYQDNSGHIISDPGAIAVNYLTGWFITDLVSIFPFNSILSNGDASSGGNRLARLARLPRALRMVRVVKVGRLMQLPILMSLWSSLEDTFLSLPAFAAVLRTLGMSALFAHWIACAWHWIGISPAVGGDLRDMQPDESWIAAAGLSERTVAERYIASVYWTLVTMSTVGFGDISPVTAGEQGFTMLVVVIGMLGGGILVADILQVVAAQAKSSNSQRQREDGISHLLRTVAPPKPLRRRLHRWLEDSNKSAESVSDILPQLPASLRRDVLLFARKSLIDSIHFLRELRDNDAVPQGADVVADVVWKLERTTAGPGVILYVQTTPVHGMYFLSKGLVGLLRDGVQVAEMSDGAFFGAAECLFSDTYEATATSMAQTEAYVLPRQAVYELTQKYPMLFGVPLREVALQRMDSFGYTDVLDTGASATGSGIGAGRAHSMGLPQPSTLPAMPPMLSTLPAHLTVPTSSSSDHASGPGEAPEADPASTSQPPGPPPAPMPVPPPSRAAHLHSQLSGGMGQGGAGARLRRASWSPGGMAHARGTLGRQLSSSQLRGRLRGDMESTAQAREAAQQDGSARVIAAMNKGARAVVMDEVAEEDDEDAEVEEAAAFAGASTQAP